MRTPPRLALVIGSTRPTRFADKPAEWLVQQAAQRDDFTLESSTCGTSICRSSAR